MTIDNEMLGFFFGGNLIKPHAPQSPLVNQFESGEIVFIKYKNGFRKAKIEIDNEGKTFALYEDGERAALITRGNIFRNIPPPY